MLSFFYLFKLLQTDFIYKRAQGYEICETAQSVVDISLVGEDANNASFAEMRERERERDCVARPCVFCTFILMRRAFEMDLPTLRHPFKSLFKTRPKKVSLFTAKEEKKEKKIWTLSSFPDLSSLFFIEDTV